MTPWRSLAKRRYIASQPCMITGQAAQCAHIGGLAQGKGMRQKVSDEVTVPLSPHIHDIVDRRAKLPNGEWGMEAVERYYRVDFLRAAARYHEQWMTKKGKAA